MQTFSEKKQNLCDTNAKFLRIFQIKEREIINYDVIKLQMLSWVYLHN